MLRHVNRLQRKIINSSEGFLVKKIKAGLRTRAQVRFSPISANGSKKTLQALSNFSCKVSNSIQNVALD
jgi:hypothetical protein